MGILIAKDSSCGTGGLLENRFVIVAAPSMHWYLALNWSCWAQHRACADVASPHKAMLSSGFGCCIVASGWESSTTFRHARQVPQPSVRVVAVFRSMTSCLVHTRPAEHAGRRTTGQPCSSTLQELAVLRPCKRAPRGPFRRPHAYFGVSSNGVK